jgi:CelD/BcsL family acetyltransferase involved in cellulose biosynthesis
VSYEHCVAWWAHYGSGRDLRVFVFRDGGELVGIVPMFVERIWLGPVCMRIAGIVGSDSTPVVVDLPVRPERAREVFAAVLRHLLGELRCDAVKFAPLSGQSALPAAIGDAARGLGSSAALLRDAELGPHSTFELPGDFDAYLRSLDKKQRGNYRRAMKTLDASGGAAVDVVGDEAQLLSEFPAFVRMHEEQWHETGKLGHFRDWPLAEDYHRGIVGTFGAAGRAHLLRLRVAGEVVSYQLCYSFGDTLHWVLPARVVRPELDRYSLGRLGVVHLAEFAIRAGFRRIEAGIGRYDYKLQLGATEHTARSIVVAGRPGVSRVRVELFVRLAAALDVVYYRAWFKRIAPRLPLPRAPLWNTWIRTRL